MTDFGFKVSGQGNDVKTTAKSDLLSYSEGLSFKTFLSGTTTLTLDGTGAGIKTITHNLGFAPAFMTFLKSSAVSPSNGTTYPNCYFSPVGYDNKFLRSVSDFEAYSDATSLYIQVWGGTPLTTITLSYFIFADIVSAFTSDVYKGTKDMGIKIAKEGLSASESSLYELTMNSNYPPMKFKKGDMGTSTLHLNAFTGPVGGFQTMVTEIPHNKGYIPVFLVSYQVSGGPLFRTPFMTLNGLDQPDYWVEAFVDATKLRLAITRQLVSEWSTHNAEDVTFKYLIFSEPIQ